MDDTVTYYDEAEKLARDLQQHEQAASLHDEFVWHSKVLNQTRSVFGGPGGLIERFDLVLPPVRNMIAIGIVLSLLAIGVVTALLYDGATDSQMTSEMTTEQTDSASSSADENLDQEVYVGFKSIAKDRQIEYQLRLGVDWSTASVDAFVVNASSEKRTAVNGSRCTRAVSGLNRTHQCVATLDSALPPGKYVLEIDARIPEQAATTVRTKRFALE